MRRLLPSLAIAQATGILAAEWGWLAGTAALWLGLASMALAAVGLALGVRSVTWRVAAAVALALASGALDLDAGRASPAPAHSDTVVLEATVGEVRRGSALVRVEAEEVAAEARLSRRARLYARSGEPLTERLPGARIRALVRTSEPTPATNPGARRPDLGRAGIGAVGRLVHPTLVVRLPEGEGLRPLAELHALRMQLGERLAEAGVGGALLRALALGDRGSLDESVREDFARLGLAHLLAVSGLHLALVSGLGFAVGRRALARSATLAARFDTRLLALGGAVGLALGYALLAGWGIPARRAWVFLLAALAAILLNRPRAMGGPFALATLWVLSGTPHALFEPGAQLSFAAALALALAARRSASSGAVGPGSRLVRALAASAPAVGVSAPLAAYHFGQAAPFSLLANAIAVPVTGVLLLPAAVLATLAALVPELPGAALALWVSERLAAGCLATVGIVAEWLPNAAAGVRPGTAWIAVGALLGAASVLARRASWRIGWALAGGVVLALAPPAAVAPLPPRMFALDVGQGDAVLVQGREGALLVDAGTALPDGFDLGRRTVVPALAALGVRRLDLLVASHADLDHRGGLPAVLASVTVDRLWLPPGGSTDPALETVRNAATHSGTKIEERGRGAPSLRVGDIEVEVLWPPPDATGSRNDRSLVLRVAVGGAHVLLTGDLEAAGELALIASGADLRADILKLGHHGSRTSSTAEFLAAVDPVVAIASAPCAGRFEMPHREVVSRVRGVGASLGFTGRDGAIGIALAPAPVVFPWSARPRRCR